MYRESFVTAPTTFVLNIKKSTLLVLISSFSFDDGLGQTFSIFIISIAGAESVIGLSILVAFYRSSLINLIMVFGFSAITFNNGSEYYSSFPSPALLRSKQGLAQRSGSIECTKIPLLLLK